MNDPTITLAFAVTLLVPAGAAAQSTQRSELVLHAEPIAAGVRYTHAVSAGVAIGPALIAGPFHGVTLRKEGFGSLREWAAGYLTVVAGIGAGARVILQPIGAALAIGDDFGAVYPTAQAGIEIMSGRARIGTDVRVLRIAGGNGTGLYWIQWIPLRAGIAWRR